MAKAIIDPDEVRQFAHDLHHFGSDLQGRMSTLHGRFVALSETWQDQEQEKFAEEFEQTTRVLAKFIDACNRHAPYLMRKAARIEEYLNQR